MGTNNKNHRNHRKTATGVIPAEIEQFLSSMEESLAAGETAPGAEYAEQLTALVVDYFTRPDKEDEKRLKKTCRNKLSHFIQSYPFSFYRKLFFKYETLEDFIEDLIGSWQIRFRVLMAGCAISANWSEHTYYELVEKSVGWLGVLKQRYPKLYSAVGAGLRKASKDYYHEQDYPRWLESMVDEVTEEFFIENFAKSRNEMNIELYKEYERTSMMRLALRTASNAMRDVMPEHYTDLFPNARQLKRHFVLHVGPTNSGKTYDALQALRKAGGGIYLAPLRLLAFEKFSELNEDGYACSLLTGEERILTPDSTFQASTIEMADFEKEYPVAVIDEAQMLEDESRGCRWTAAILGICAPEIHICMAPYALDLVIRLIGECHDTYEVVKHQRNTKLVCSEKNFKFPEDVESKDALIVFSRKDVHAVAAQLKAHGKKASLIYGSLPYDVRQEQARMFREGENDIVVATDAIGMGVNLPIRRVVLLELKKFDGTRKRPLQAGEIQQIAGRAGRFGMYDEGIYTCEGEADSDERILLKRSISQNLMPLTTAYVSFPETLLDIQLPVSSLLKKWDSLEKRDGYITSFVMRDRTLALHLEHLAEEMKNLDIIRDRRMIYSFASIPFNEDSDELFCLWSETFIYYAETGKLDVELLEDSLTFNYGSRELDYLERCSQICDLFYQLVLKTDGDREYLDRVMEEKRLISDCIIAILDKHEYASKRCKCCQRELNFDYPFGYCERCFDRMNRDRRRRGPRK